MTMLSELRLRHLRVAVARADDATDPPRTLRLREILEALECTEISELHSRMDRMLQLAALYRKSDKLIPELQAARDGDPADRPSANASVLQGRLDAIQQYALGLCRPLNEHTPLDYVCDIARGDHDHD